MDFIFSKNSKHEHLGFKDEQFHFLACFGYAHGGSISSSFYFDNN